MMVKFKNEIDKDKEENEEEIEDEGGEEVVSKEDL